MLQAAEPPLVLASASASRRALLAAAGLRFSVQPADLDETAVKRDAAAQGLPAEAAALRLAELKAAAVAQSQPAALVIGADQILVCGDQWFDKPPDAAAAAEQLRALRGQAHTLATAVVCHRAGQRIWHDIVSPRLTMRRFSDGFLAAYLAAEGAGVTQTVGAYRLEGRGVHLFASVEGEHAAILGLPLLSLLAFLRDALVVAE